MQVQTQAIAAYAQNFGRREWLREFWTGERKLWEAFWFLLVAAGFAFNLVTRTVLPNILFRFFPSYGRMLARESMELAHSVFFIALAAAVWQCAPNVKWVGWRRAARAFSLFVIFMEVARAALSLRYLL